jgi:hypothetical protein
MLEVNGFGFGFEKIIIKYAKIYKRAGNFKGKSF